MARDQRNDSELRAMGWYVVRFWEKDVKQDIDRCVSVIIQLIANNSIDSFEETFSPSE